MTPPQQLRWLVTGAAGMLGRDVVAVLESQGAPVTVCGRTDLDVTDADAVDAAVRGHDVVVNAAGWTDVDGAETREAEAARVNADGPALLAASCARHGARLLHVSTDYVFAGDATTPYAEDAAPAPRTAYGRTKLRGEQALLSTLPDSGVVLRTAWLYGAHGPNFVTTMVRLAAERDTVDVVVDQRGQPTWAYDLARRIVEVGPRDDVAGVLHATSQGETSWHGLAQAVFEEIGADPRRVRPVTSAQFRRPAPRPAYSVLGHARWGGVGLPPLPHWREALRRGLPDVTGRGRRHPS